MTEFLDGASLKTPIFKTKTCLFTANVLSLGCTRWHCMSVQCECTSTRVDLIVDSDMNWGLKGQHQYPYASVKYLVKSCF